MINYLLDLILCGIIFISEIIGIILIIGLILGISNKVFGINIIKIFNKKINKLEKYIENNF